MSSKLYYTKIKQLSLKKLLKALTLIEINLKLFFKQFLISSVKKHNISSSKKKVSAKRSSVLKFVNLYLYNKENKNKNFTEKIYLFVLFHILVFINLNKHF